VRKKIDYSVRISEMAKVNARALIQTERLKR